MPMGLARKFESDAEKFESIQKIREIGKIEHHARKCIFYILDTDLGNFIPNHAPSRRVISEARA